MSCSLTGRLTSSRLGRASTLPDRFSRLMSSHCTGRWPLAKLPDSSSTTSFFEALADGDLVANLALEGRDVDLAAVDLDMAVANQLAGLATRHGEAEAVADVVQAGLKLLEQEFAGDASLVRGLLVVGAELGFQGEVSGPSRRTRSTSISTC